MLHRYDAPPVAVSVVGPPAQTVGLDGVMLHTGAGVTVTVNEHELLQPLASVTVTV